MPPLRVTLPADVAAEQMARLLTVEHERDLAGALVELAGVRDELAAARRAWRERAEAAATGTTEQ